MDKKVVKLLLLQISKLDADDFDLEAWKSGTVSQQTRLLGETDPRARQISDLKIDYRSWALRDSTSGYNPVATCKKKGKSILETTIEEIQILGITGAKTSSAEILEKYLGKDEDFSSKERRIKALNKMKKEKLIALVEDLIH